MERPWLSQYPPGVPAEIDVAEYQSVRDVFEESCRTYAKRPAFTCMGRQITFADLDAQSSTFGGWLQSVGCTRGTRIALMMPNILQYPICVFGALRAGCTVVNVNPLYTARELEHQLIDSGAEVIVVVENFARTLSQAIARTRIRQVIVTSIGELLAAKGRVVDLVLRRVKRMVPPWTLPGAIRFTDAMKAGRKRALSRIPIGHDDIHELITINITDSQITLAAARLLAEAVLHQLPRQFAGLGFRPSNLGHTHAAGLSVNRQDFQTRLTINVFERSGPRLI